MKTVFILNQYFLSICFGVLCQILLLLLIKKQQNYRQFYCLLSAFLNMDFLISIIAYAGILFHATKGAAPVPAVFRMMEYASYTALFFTWILLTEFICRDFSTVKTDRYFMSAKLFSIAGAAVLCCMAAFFMNPHYRMQNPVVNAAFSMYRTVYLTGVLFFLVYTAWKMKKWIYDHDLKCFVLSVSFFMALFYFMHMDPMSHPEASRRLPDGSTGGSGLLLVIVNILSCIFLYKNLLRQNQHALYEYPQDDRKQLKSEKQIGNIEKNTEIINRKNNQKIEILRKHCSLTDREIVVVKMVYGGSHNKEIAEQLSISPNTVKCHIHNIYEKTGTASRPELVSLINKISA